MTQATEAALRSASRGGGDFAMVSLVFPPHDHGTLANESCVSPQPPLGLLAIAAHLKSLIEPIRCRVIDGKALASEDQILSEISGNFVAFSVWYSNYDSALRLASAYRKKNPSAVILFGGPHATALGCKVLRNNWFVDFVVRGDGERPLSDLLRQIRPGAIPGLCYRRGHEVECAPVWSDPEVADYANFDLSPVVPQYLWNGQRGGPAMSAFPLAGVRGCLRRIRCEYCSIPTIGVRSMSAAKYWKQVGLLKDRHGIDYFFETGDILPPPFLRSLSAAGVVSGVGFRAYSYPGLLAEDDYQILGEVGIDTIFLGVESSLVWRRSMKRRYAKQYSIPSLFHEIKALGRVGVSIIPGFVLGLPGESRESLVATLGLIRKVSILSNVNEITVSIVLPLPGAELFARCTESQSISEKYYRETGEDLTTGDCIDYYRLSRIMIQDECSVPYGEVVGAVESLSSEIGPGFASWLE